MFPHFSCHEHPCVQQDITLQAGQKVLIPPPHMSVSVAESDIQSWTRSECQKSVKNSTSNITSQTCPTRAAETRSAPGSSSTTTDWCTSFSLTRLMAEWKSSSVASDDSAAKPNNQLMQPLRLPDAGMLRSLQDVGLLDWESYQTHS